MHLINYVTAQGCRISQCSEFENHSQFTIWLQWWWVPCISTTQSLVRLMRIKM